MNIEHINAPETGCTPEEQAAWHAGIEAGREIERNNIAAQAQPKRRRYDPNGSLGEYGIFPECDAQPLDTGITAAELGYALKRATPAQVIEYLEDDVNMRAALSIHFEEQHDQQPAAVDEAMVKRFLEAFQKTPGDEAIGADEKVARRWLTADLSQPAEQRAEVEALLDERDALRERVGQLEYSNAVNADAKAQAAKYAEEVDRLRERVKELEADAERYRWLRDKCDRWDGGLVVAEVTEFSLSSWSGDDLNGAIDEAMEKEVSND